jgi:multidrug transporter EmrE-like cation transporter
MACIDVVMMGMLKLEYIKVLHGTWILPLAMAIYSLQPMVFRSGLPYEGIAVLNIMWNTLSILIISLLGLFFFEEKLSRINALGMILSILGIILIKW